jgi:hypothetical protein
MWSAPGAERHHPQLQVLELAPALLLVVPVAGAASRFTGVHRKRRAAAGLVGNHRLHVDLGSVLAACEQATELRHGTIETGESFVPAHARCTLQCEGDRNALTYPTLRRCGDAQGRMGGGQPRHGPHGGHTAEQGYGQQNSRHACGHRPLLPSGHPYPVSGATNHYRWINWADVGRLSPWF